MRSSQRNVLVLVREAVGVGAKVRLPPAPIPTPILDPPPARSIHIPAGNPMFVPKWEARGGGRLEIRRCARDDIFFSHRAMRRRRGERAPETTVGGALLTHSRDSHCEHLQRMAKYSKRRESQVGGRGEHGSSDFSRTRQNYPEEWRGNLSALLPSPLSLRGFREL